MLINANDSTMTSPGAQTFWLTVQPVLCFGTNIKLPGYWNSKTLPTHTYTHSVFAGILPGPPPTPHVFSLEDRDMCYMTNSDTELHSVTSLSQS